MKKNICICESSKVGQLVTDDFVYVFVGVCICICKYLYLYLYFIQCSVASDELDQLVTDDFNCGFYWQAGSLMSATTIII